jgi:hypothetical protein
MATSHNHASIAWPAAKKGAESKTAHSGMRTRLKTPKRKAAASLEPKLNKFLSEIFIKFRTNMMRYE